jgi:hypothetical protein
MANARPLEKEIHALKAQHDRWRRKSKCSIVKFTQGACSAVGEMRLLSWSGKSSFLKRRTGNDLAC